MNIFIMVHIDMTKYYYTKISNTTFLRMKFIVSYGIYIVYYTHINGRFGSLLPTKHFTTVFFL